MTDAQSKASAKAPTEAQGRAGFRPDARLLAEIKSLSFRARVVADSAVSGIHRARHHGSSVEFAEHKEYAPGDNLRHLDWRVYARTERDYVKRFEDEANLRVLLVLDTSASMGYPDAEARESKFEYAKTMAAALAYLLSQQGDAVGLAEFNTELRLWVPPRARRGHLEDVLGRLAQLQPGGATALGPALDRLSEGLTRKTVVLLFSDLLDGGLSMLDRLAQIRARRHDAAVFQVLDSDELEFPFEEQTRFVGVETTDEVAIDARSIRDAYLREVNRFLEDARQRCRTTRVDHVLCNTRAAPGPVLSRFLNERRALRGRAK